MPRRIDTHQHFWNLAEVEYSWLVPEYGPIYATFTPKDLEPQLREAGIDRTIVVQSANSYEDTAHMLFAADEYDWIGGVIGWVNLLDPSETARRISMYSRHPKFRGVRHLIHTEPNPDWVIQPTVIESLKVLADAGMIFEVVAVFPNHLRHVPALAEQIPNLTLVIDHLAKPPIADRVMGQWAEELSAAAAHPSVYAKVSGLNTAAEPDWTADSLKPYIDFAIDRFGPQRLMFGSDWPVAILSGSYASVWEATKQVLSSHGADVTSAILGGTAETVYRPV